MSSTVLHGGIAALCLFAQDALAQVPAGPSRDRVVYEAGFFQQFAPRTALDMVNQTPGFVLSAPDEDERRGYAGAVGNVLIDGQRLSAKSQSLRDVLERVPAGDVVRIEILRGAEVAGDASNATALANVVRTRASGSGTWEGGTEMSNRRKVAPYGQFGWSGRNEGTDYSLGATMYNHDHDSPSVRQVFDGDGTLIANAAGHNVHEESNYTLNGQVALPAGDGKLVVTGQGAYHHYQEDYSLRTATPDDVELTREQTPYEESTRTFELGVDYQRELGAWNLDVLALATRKRNPSDVTSTFYDDVEAQTSVFTQHSQRDSGETILRGTFSRPLARGRMEWGAETAFNTLEQDLALTLDDGAGPTPLAIPNANLSVEEKRAEAFVSHALRLGENWALDSRLAAETSRLSFTGDTEQSVSLTYVKPRLQVTRKFGKHQLQIRAFRDVGQLNFNDFVSTVQISDDVVHGGNPDLKPQTAWATEIEADLRFPNDTALRIRAFKHFLDDVADLVPVGLPGDQVDAPGNIGRGTMIGAEMSFRVSLAAVLRGGTLSATGLWRDTDVRDPLTGRRRMISNFPENTLKIELRQDIGASRIAWGLNYAGSSADSDFRIGEVDSFRELRRLDPYIETTAFEGFKLKLIAYNALSDTEYRRRSFYSPDRAGALSEREIINYRPGTWWLVTLSSSF